MIKVKRALISLSDKRELIPLAEGLNRLGVEIVSTGGTSKVIRNAGIEVKEISDLTGFPELLGGRVKTLHPVVHAGILAKREEGHLQEIAAHGIQPIDLLIVNLYPFLEAIREGLEFDRVIEQIDIGGVALIRAGAKNFRHVVVVVDPSRYKEILHEIEEKGGVSEETSFTLATEAFGYTAFYDAIISNYLNRERGALFPTLLTLPYRMAEELRYGENPHQDASFYYTPLLDGLSGAVKLQGKPLSYNNILDVDAAIRVCVEFGEPCCAIIKHTNPCGLGVADDLISAFRMARECDPVSAFGGIVAINREVDGDVAQEITKGFIEVVVAPGFNRDALEVFSKKRDLRLLTFKEWGERKGVEIRGVDGGLLVQTQDNIEIQEENLRFVTSKRPSKEEITSLLFAMKVARHVKSNAIVLAKERRTTGIGAGQMSRVDALRVAIMKGGERVKGSVLASDAFFPFRDVVDEAAKAGIKAIIQPGGSIRDNESIEAANEHGIPMVFTGTRHFRH